MKKTLCLALILALSFTLAAPAAAASIAPVPEDALSLSSPCAILMEKTTGTIIYEKNAHESGAPASVTKVMTLLLIA
ncbi:MAG: D-alanyl-D-alanine carboxypeptidase, partial [Clostridia bacterium]|nr:D-alanyl-D-alanine carboxypeptidase [Clostridia bacterium]